MAPVRPGRTLPIRLGWVVFTLCFLDSSLGCSHSDAEKVISTLVQHSPDLRERIILRKTSIPDGLAQGSTLRAKKFDQFCQTKLSLSLSLLLLKKTSNCESALDQVLKKRLDSQRLKKKEACCHVYEYRLRLFPSTMLDMEGIVTSRKKKCSSLFTLPSRVIYKLSSRLGSGDVVKKIDVADPL
ncbi:hypothetical protein Sjap_026664 [Stephania japonica]|uniref:Uncharacterized protein n=1 Tax=Stephania japonica TaxID=461633 RepID=A0AAP0DZ65_9MAGN